MPTALAAGALASACVLPTPAGATPAGATPPSYGSNGLISVNTQPRVG